MARSGFHILLAAALLVCLGLFPADATGFDTELHHRILNSLDASGPYVAGETILFSFRPTRTTQSVSLAFEHEDYRVFRDFERNPHGVFVLTVPVPEGASTLRYRLIVDGLWTVDPNSSTERDARGILVSSVLIPADYSAPKPGITTLPDGSTRFVYTGDPGSRVSLIGDFNRWDPYLTPMEESWAFPGVYEANLMIPENARFYRFVVDGREITDPANPIIARNGWGVDASPINQ